MAATGYTPISLYYSTTASAVPVNTNLVAGELALNTLDEKLYFKNSAGTVKLLASNAASSATVSSVAQSFTGGLISVAGSPITTSGTLALTVAGTSGGVPYFSSASTWATSAALTQYGVVYGGGAGAAPVATANGTTGQAFIATTGAAPSWGTLGVAGGGTGQTTYTNGQLLIGNTTGNTLTKATLTAGTGITITNGTGSITIAASGSVSAATPTVLGTVYGKVDTTNSNFSIGQFSLSGGSLSGTNNVALGSSTLISATTGNNNTVVGHNAGYTLTTGSNNVLLGYSVGIGGGNLSTGSNNIVIGYNAATSSTTVSNEVTLGNTSMVSTRLYGMVALNMAMFEQATVSATAATGTVQYDARTQSVLYYTSNASGNWNLNLRGASGTSLDSIMAVGQSLTIAFLVTNGSTAYYQSLLLVDGTTVTPKWQGGTAPSSGNASAVDIYVITVIKTASATFSAFASQTKFA